MGASMSFIKLLAWNQNRILQGNIILPISIANIAELQFHQAGECGT